MTDSPDWFTPATNVTLGTVDTDVQAVGTKVDAVGTKVTTVGTKVDAVATQVTAVQSSVNALQAGYGGAALVRFLSFGGGPTPGAAPRTVIGALGIGVHPNLVSFAIVPALPVPFVSGIVRNLWDTYYYELVSGAIPLATGILTPEMPQDRWQIPAGLLGDPNTAVTITIVSMLGDTAMQFDWWGQYFVS